MSGINPQINYQIISLHDSRSKYDSYPQSNVHIKGKNNNISFKIMLELFRITTTSPIVMSAKTMKIYPPQKVDLTDSISYVDLDLIKASSSNSEVFKRYRHASDPYCNKVGSGTYKLMKVFKT